MPVDDVARNDSVISVTLAAAALDVLVFGVVLKVSVSAGDATASERGFLVSVNSLAGGTRFSILC